MRARPRNFIPPNGFVGQGQQTAANQLVAGGIRAAPARRRRRKATRSSLPKRKSAKRASSRRTAKPKRLVKGSKAAKAYMAKLRRMRKR